MSYQVEVDFGSGWVDISTKLYGRLPVSSTRAIHKSLKPVIDTARFRIVRDQTLINQFLSATSDVPVRIHLDSADYFTGIIRPTHKAKIGHIRAESFAVECVDAWYTLDRTFTGAPFVMRSCNVSNPTTKASSILHQLFYRAGFADASLSLGAIAISVAAFTVDTTTGSAPTFRKIIEQLISENGYTAYVDESGIVRLYDLGPSSITASGSFSSGSAGNMAEGYEIQRREGSVEAVDVSYYPPKTMTAQVVFADTTGGTDLQEATIVIAPGGYYPQGADATHSVDAEFKIENYEIIDTQSAALIVEVSAGSVPTTQVFTAESKKAKLRLYSSGGCTIKKLNITGTATVKGDLGKAIRENVALTTKREQIELDYMGDSATAARLSILLANWHRDALYEYAFDCTDLSVKPGDYRTFSELAIMGISTTVRVVSVSRGLDEKTVGVTTEAVAEFVAATVSTEAQVVSRPRGPQGVDGADGRRTAILEMYRWSASTPTTWPSGSSTYTWATGLFTAPATPNSWTIVPGTAVVGQKLYATRVIYSDTDTSDTDSVTWPSTGQSAYEISYAGIDGDDGADGANGEGVYNYASALVTRSNYNRTLARTSGGPDWTGSYLNTLEKFGQVTVGFSPGAIASCDYIVGLVPATGSAYNAANTFWFRITNANLFSRLAGVDTANGTVTTASRLQVTYDGATVRFIKDGTVVAFQAYATGLLYVKVFLNTLSAIVNDFSVSPSAMGFRPTWITDMVIPSTVDGVLAKLLDAPSGTAGMYYGESYMGYKDASTWRAYIGNDGKFLFGNADGSKYLKWDGSSLEMKGKIVLSDAAGTPGSSGLYVASDKLGFYSGTAWRSYIDNAGNLFLYDSTTTKGLSFTASTGALIVGVIAKTGNYLEWDGTSLNIVGNLNLGSGKYFSNYGGTVRITPDLSAADDGIVISSYDQKNSPVAGDKRIVIGSAYSTSGFAQTTYGYRTLLLGSPYWQTLWNVSVEYANVTGSIAKDVTVTDMRWSSDTGLASQSLVVLKSKINSVSTAYAEFDITPMTGGAGTSFNFKRMSGVSTLIAAGAYLGADGSRWANIHSVLGNFSGIVSVLGVNVAASDPINETYAMASTYSGYPLLVKVGSVASTSDADEDFYLSTSGNTAFPNAMLFVACGYGIGAVVDRDHFIINRMNDLNGTYEFHYIAFGY